MSRRKVSYYYDSDVGSYSYGLGHLMKPLRMRITHELLTAYDLLGKMEVMRADRATPESMSAFHTDEYVNFLKNVTPETAESMTFGGTRFLMNYDNPAFEGVFEFCSISAGGTLAAAKRLGSGAADIAINWAGGLHHAKKSEASGFCYINDIVLGILELLRTFPRVLYIDIDSHHGDGVEEAFYSSDRVMTCSFHKFGNYFPGTGDQSDRGSGKGTGYAVNVPLSDGLSDTSFRSVFDPVIDKIVEVFRPSAIVLQCGSDSLAGDRLGCFNVTMHGHAHCVQYVRALDIPLILLGGGGYTVKNASRTWAYETACALGVEKDMDLNLPWNDFFEWFAPRYRLEVVEHSVEDLNQKDGSLQRVRETALGQLSELPPAPSVALQDVPRESLGDHLGLWRDSQLPDELDQRLAQTAGMVYTLQEPESSHTATDDDDDDDSEPSSTRRRSSRLSKHAKGKKRMSILTNEWQEVPSLDLPCGYHEHGARAEADRTTKRFFDSGLRWEASQRRAVVERYPGGLGIGDVMMEGGRYGSVEVMDIDDPVDE